MSRFGFGLSGVLVVAFMWLVLAHDAAALSMTGALQVHSTLHQPFAADIPLVLESGEALPQVQAYVGLDSDYVGAKRDATKQMRLTAQWVEGDSLPAMGKTGRIMLAGTVPVTEPFFTLLLHISQPDRSFVRNFSVVLDAFPTTGLEPIFPVQSNRARAALPAGVKETSGGGLGWMGTNWDWWLVIVGLLIVAWLGWRLVERRRELGMPMAWQMTEHAREELVASGLMSAFVDTDPPSVNQPESSIVAVNGASQAIVREEPLLQLPQQHESEVIVEVVSVADQPSVEPVALAKEEEEADDELDLEEEADDELDLDALSAEAGLDGFFSMDTLSAELHMDPESVEAELAAFGEFSAGKNEDALGEEEEWVAVEGSLEQEEQAPEPSLAQEAGKPFWSDSSTSSTLDDNTFVPKASSEAETIETISFSFDDLAEEDSHVVFDQTPMNAAKREEMSKRNQVSEEERILSLEFEPFESDELVVAKDRVGR